MAQWIKEGSSNSIEWKSRLVIDLISQNITSNQSTLKITFQFTRARSSSTAWNGSNTSYGITLDGHTQWGTCNSYNYSSIGVNDWKTIGSMTLVTGHDAIGNKIASISGQWSQSGVQPTSCNASTNITLPTIPRTSSVTCNDGNIGSSTTINISRASSNFTHKLEWWYSSSSKGGDIADGVSTSTGWTIPTVLYSKIPNAKFIEVIIYCYTYNGGTQIGYTSCRCKCFVVNSAPTVSASVIDNNLSAVALTGSNQKLIKGVSNARVVTTAKGLNSATISSIQVTCGDGKSGTGADTTLYRVTSANFTIKVTDSRGFTTTITKTLTLVDYIEPAIIELSVARLETTSPLTKIKVKGNVFSGSFGVEENARKLSYWWRENGTTEWGSEITLTPTTVSGTTFTYEANLTEGFDINKVYDICVRISDKITVFDKYTTLGKSIPLIIAYKDGIDINGNIQQNGKDFLKMIQPYKSGRDYTSGFLIKTSLPAAAGIAFYVKIEGNGYQEYPINTVLQGYCYGNTIINTKGVNMSGTQAMSVVEVFGYEGKMCFWFSQKSYWEGVLATCYDVGNNKGGNIVNTVTDIVNQSRPDISATTYNASITLKSIAWM